jgi:fibronectin-binding autotransporter adhesin
MTHNHITHKHLAAASPVALALGMLAFSAAPAFADTCTLSGTPSVWSLGASGNWSVAGNWAPSGEPNSSSTNVCIVDNTSTVTLNVSATIASLQIASGNSLDMANTLFVNGPSISNGGTITVPGTTLQFEGSTTLSGGGTVQMSSDAFVNESTSGLTLSNASTIEGTGQLGQNGLALTNESGGTVSANVSGGTLTLNGGGLVTNAGLLTATGGGIMTIDNNVANTSGNITASGTTGGTVNLQNAITVTGGTLNTSGNGVVNGENVTLSGVTVSTGSTLTDTDVTKLQGTITNNGTITNPGNTLQVTGGDVTLTGGGTVTMSADAFFNESTTGLTLHNVNNTIEGSGQLGQNGLALDNQSGGMVTPMSAAGR